MKTKLLKITTVTLAVLSCMAAAIVLYAVSPLHPENLSAEEIVRNGAEYSVRLKGITEYDEGGFYPATEGFFFSGGERVYIYKDEEGFARTTYDGVGEGYMKSSRSSSYIAYDSYSFCGSSYKNQQELETFFESPDPIYNFDINDLSYYVQDVINYEKKFTGKATIRLYRGRCVITDMYIGEEKVLELNITK